MSQSVILSCKVNSLPHSPHFYDLIKESFSKTLWEKEKMLVTSIFSFSHNNFYPFQREFLYLSYIFNLSSASAFNLDQSKILSFGKELIYSVDESATLNLTRTLLEFLVFKLFYWQKLLEKTL